MNEEKYCPLFTIGTSALKIESPQKCMKENCAWWVNTRAGFKECAITSIARGCGYIGE